jgi:hypothetical protein
VCVQAQGLDMLEAMASRELIEWSEIDDAMDSIQVSWDHMRGLPSTLNATVVVLSRLDTHGSLAAWTLRPGDDRPAVTVFDSHDVLAQVGKSWSAFLHTVYEAGGCIVENQPQLRHAPAGEVEENRVLSMMYKACWAPLVKTLGDDSKHVVLCVQGDLARVPWMGLVDDQGKAVGDTWSVATEPCVCLLISATQVCTAALQSVIHVFGAFICISGHPFPAC